MKQELFGLFLYEIGELLQSSGVAGYRARQVAEWMYLRRVTAFADMTNLPKDLRAFLDEHFSICRLPVIAEQHSQDQKTSKYLLRLNDGHAIETVLMRQPYGNSVCVSSQVGCAMGCTFCASSLHGLLRNLSAGEILNQVYHFSRILNGGVNSIVIMGSGEPLANYDQVLKFIRLCHEEYCLNMSYRSITVSTSGIIPAIERLAKEGLPVNLSISLHAPNNEIRSRLMPINKKYPIEALITAADGYAKSTGRRVTYEYTLIKDVNDRPHHARELVSRIKGQLVNVNLIPVNTVSERGLLKPDTAAVREFEGILKKHRITTTVRREMGADIQAACGQLRHKSETGNLYNG